MRTMLLLSLLLAVSAEARPIRVCIIGDSISEGASPSTVPWSVYLKRMHGGEDFGVKNVADAGDGTADAALVQDTEVVGRGCTHVVIAIGTNNVATDSAATMYAAVDAMADEAEAETTNGRPVQVILAAMLPRVTFAISSATIEGRRTAYNTLLEARSGSIFADTSAALTGTASGTAWVALTAYSLNDVRVNGGKAYICTTAGTSAGSGGPTGTGTGITDGSAVWAYAPALGTEYGGATDGLHPNNAGQAAFAVEIEAAVVAAGGW